jgi:hypothetical protein
MKKFCNRDVVVLNGYPAVIWPEHPVAYKNDGRAYIHRIVIHDALGSIPNTYQIHHVNGNKWDWSLENLELVTAQEHVNIHHSAEVSVRSCSNCGKDVSIRTTRRKKKNRVFCSEECLKTMPKISWPSIEELIQLVRATNFVQAGKKLGVTDNAIRKHLRKYGVDPKKL